MNTATNDDQKLKVWNKYFHILAMKDEEKQLLGKINSFRDWLTNEGEDAFKGRVEHQYENDAYSLAKDQLNTMQEYADILHKRILLFEKCGI